MLKGDFDVAMHFCPCWTTTVEDNLIKRLNERKDNMENRDMRVHMNKTKVMITAERQKVM